MGKFQIPSGVCTTSPVAIQGPGADHVRMQRDEPRPRHPCQHRMLTSIPKVNGDGDVSRLVALARRISADADKVDAYLRENNLPQPGFEVDAPGDFPSLPADVQQSRQQIVHDALELGRLARGPRETVRWGVWNV